MRAFWRQGESAEVEGRLRQARPQPSRDLVNGIVARIEARRLRRAFGFRLGLAAGLTAIFLVAFAGLGGFGYAEIAASNAAKAVKNAGNGNSNGNGGAGGVTIQSHKPGHDQYGPERITICHRPPGNPANERTLVLPEPAAEAHLRNHPEDTPGPC